MKEVRFITYGCKANQYDTQVLREAASEIGASFCRSLDGAGETVVLEGSVGLSGRYQRVIVPMGEDLFPGDLVRVTLRAEVSGEGEVSLRGERVIAEVCA